MNWNSQYSILYASVFVLDLVFTIAIRVIFYRFMFRVLYMLSEKKRKDKKWHYLVNQY